MSNLTEPRQRQSHIFERDLHGHYVDPTWCSRRLFEVEDFDPLIWDPCCGWGHVIEAAVTKGYSAVGSDIVDRRGDPDAVPALQKRFRQGDFFTMRPSAVPFSIVGNSPFDMLPKFAERALQLAPKVAFIWQLRRLPAAHWLRTTPLARIYLMTPRPSMPTGEHIAGGGHVGGDRQEYCWLIWQRDHGGSPEMHWLFRDAVHTVADKARTAEKDL